MNELRAGAAMIGALDQEATSSVYFTGGEPTEWHDGPYDVRDVIREFARQGIQSRLVTNGQIFQEPNETTSWLRTAFDGVGTQVEVWVTIDVWHNNVAATSLRVDVLETLLAARQYLAESGRKLLIRAQGSIGRSPHLAPPFDLIEHYTIERNLPFRLSPLLPWGGATNQLDEVPFLSPLSKDKSGLGAYLPYYYLLHRRVGTVSSMKEFLDAHNLYLLNSACLCGFARFCYAGTYYPCITTVGHPEFAICRIGNLEEEELNRFFGRYPLMDVIRKVGPILAMILCEPYLSREARQSVANILRSELYVGNSGCVICDRLLETGAWHQLNDLYINSSQMLREHMQANWSESITGIEI